MRRTGSIALVLIGTSLAAVYSQSYRSKPPPNADGFYDDGDFGPATTQPASGSHGTHHHYYASGFSDDWHSRSSSGTRSSSFSHTSRGGFGAHGHAGS